MRSRSPVRYPRLRQCRPGAGLDAGGAGVTLRGGPLSLGRMTSRSAPHAPSPTRRRRGDPAPRGSTAAAGPPSGRPPPVTADAPTQPHRLTAVAQAAALRAGELSSVELVEHHLRRIEELDPVLGAFVTV